MKFIVKLFPEIMIKGGPVKKRMINMLNENLRTLLFRIDDSIEIKRFFDKIEVQTKDEFTDSVRKVLQQTPGIEQYLEVVQYETGDDLEAIAEKVAEHNLNLINGKTFVVRAKRNGEHQVTSSEIERFVGSYMYKHGESAGVDLRNPEVKVEFELIQNTLNVITKRQSGLGGFPIGMQGDVLSLMSGGFDSTVASYLTMKRGIKTHFIFFNLGGAAHEVGVKQVALYLWSQFGASHRVQFISVPFEEVVEEIFRSTHESYMGVTLKRLMIMASEKIAEVMGIDALVTGESVAQVSSQTLRNLAIIDEVSNKLILRPLATMNKPEIVKIADKIGTREFAENMPEYCGVISKNPVTNGSFSRMAKEASRFDYDVLEKAVEQSITIPVDKIIEDVNTTAPVEVVNTPDGAIVIDIRRESEASHAPLDIENVNIPFNELNRTYKKLDQSQQYLLYCEKGVMSQLHAQYLRDAGFENIRVYRPK
ncbi:tRNA uracil 4-sulfurtransferase ThiI [Thiomicrorhabdus lithotrophica]|uniref:tRNA sulfurtransferase n=1 Tax=Thiomicrorhabdus lithotrophica TaxID=2949997 RepID=A0ABY8CBH1_9GAMM|nr:tRNA uracil 4-sulfurtransferase ThiI [Thiomicrorhabdus lithotrophica]WEJ63326.1 tRNA 4-thiouridine(8) synthase ThiI [Thiomicrorhabdus lithotrophica]